MHNLLLKWKIFDTLMTSLNIKREPKRLTMTPCKKLKLKDIAIIEAGYPFRGRIQEVVDGDVQVIEPKSVLSSGELDEQGWTKTNLVGKRVPTLLEEGDVLFLGRGGYHLAVEVPEVNFKTVCSPNFFVIRCKPDFKKEINLSFVAWQLNQRPAQSYFNRCKDGSLQPHIKRAVLEDVNLYLPSINEQNTIAQMHKLQMKEQKLLLSLIENRQRQMTALAEAFREKQKDK